MEIKERYCSFEVSKLLREKGFTENTIGTYNGDGVFYLYKHEKGYNHNHLHTWYSAPTHQMACNWIRITRNLYIDIYYDGGDKAWLFSIISLPNGTVVHTSSTKNNAPNEATEEALKFVLTKLI